MFHIIFSDQKYSLNTKQKTAATFSLPTISLLAHLAVQLVKVLVFPQWAQAPWTAEKKRFFQAGG